MTEAATSLRCYLVAGKGVYLTALVVVFALDEESAIDQALPLLQAIRPQNRHSGLAVRDNSRTGATVVEDGNY